MKEHPILFSTDMVKAILAGRKTQTRRVIKLNEFGLSDTPGYKYHFRGKNACWNDVNDQTLLKYCPYGQIGDRLWVREIWGTDYKPDDKYPTSGKNEIYYKEAELELSIFAKSYWRSPIFMSREASRITLEIKDIRVERLQEITEEDAIAEGISFKTAKILAGGTNKLDPDSGLEFALNHSPKMHYEYLWDSINAKKYPWDSNPWVWVIEFKRIDL